MNTGARTAVAACAPTVLRIEQPACRWRSLALAITEGWTAVRLRDGPDTPSVTTRVLERLHRVVPMHSHVSVRTAPLTAIETATLTRAEWNEIAGAVEDAADALRTVPPSASATVNRTCWSRSAVCLTAFANVIAAARHRPGLTVWRVPVAGGRSSHPHHRGSHV